MRQRRGVTGSSVIGKGRSFAGSEQTFSTTERTSERILLIFKKTLPWIDADKFATEDGPWASDTVTNTYNNRFRTALSLEQPTGTWTNGFGYDEFARLTNVISPAGTSAYQYRDITLASGDHTACELVARLNLPNTSYITNNQDGLGRLLSTILKTSGDVILNSHEYSYNDGSQRIRQTFTGGSTYVDYYYDNISQLTNADSTVAAEKRGYFYDGAWNLN